MPTKYFCGLSIRNQNSEIAPRLKSQEIVAWMPRVIRMRIMCWISVVIVVGVIALLRYPNRGGDGARKTDRWDLRIVAGAVETGCWVAAIVWCPSGLTIVRSTLISIPSAVSLATRILSVDRRRDAECKHQGNSKTNNFRQTRRHEWFLRKRFDNLTTSLEKSHTLCQSV